MLALQVYVKLLITAHKMSGCGQYESGQGRKRGSLSNFTVTVQTVHGE